MPRQFQLTSTHMQLTGRVFCNLYAIYNMNLALAQSQLQYIGWLCYMLHKRKRKMGVLCC